MDKAFLTSIHLIFDTYSYSKLYVTYLKESRQMMMMIDDIIIKISPAVYAICPIKYCRRVSLSKVEILVLGERGVTK